MKRTTYSDDKFGENPDENEEWEDEYDEEDDEENLTLPCPFCEEEIYEDSDVCPHCGNYVFMDRSEYKHSLWADRPKSWRILGFVGVVATILALSGIGLTLFFHLLGLVLFGK